MAETEVGSRPKASPDHREVLRALRLPSVEESRSGIWVGKAWGSVAWRDRAAGVAVGALLATAAAFALARTNSPSPALRPLSAPRANENGAVSKSGLSASGYVVARRQATVAADITGRVTAITVNDGEKVTRGQVLATLDGRVPAADLQAAVSDSAGAASALDVAQAGLVDARANYERSQALSDRGFATTATLSTAKANFLKAEAEVRKASAALAAYGHRADSLRQQARSYVIRAPFDGVVVGRNAQIGEVVSPISAVGTFTRSGICTLVDMSSLELQVEVSESYLSKVRVGEEATAYLEAFPASPLGARVIALVPSVNRERGTVTVRLTLLKPDPRMLPNMSVRVAFTTY